MDTDGKVRRKGLGVRRKTIDGRRLTAAQAHARSSFVVGQSSVAQIPSFRRLAGDRNQTARGAFLAPSALFGAAWAAPRKASPPLALIHIFLNSKLRSQNLKFLRLSSARPFASPRPSGFWKALALTTHHANHTPNSKPITQNSKLLPPLLGNAGGVGGVMK
jgi:hypothetical protein